MKRKREGRREEGKEHAKVLLVILESLEVACSTPVISTGSNQVAWTHLTLRRARKYTELNPKENGTVW